MLLNNKTARATSIKSNTINVWKSIVWIVGPKSLKTRTVANKKNENLMQRCHFVSDPYSNALVHVIFNPAISTSMCNFYQYR